MKTVEEIRRYKLSLLIAEAGSQAALSEKIEKAPAQISQWLNASINSKTGKPRVMSNAIARELEQKTRKPNGWMDTDHSDTPSTSVANTTPGPAIRGQVPLISWVRAGELCESHDNYHPGDAEHWMDCPVPHGPRTYCLEISGDSMDDSTADAYRDGEIIFVDPDASADPGRDVVVRTPDNKTTFKRLKEDQEGRYLLGLNGKKIVRVPEDTVFCGVVIFSGRRR